MKYTTEYSLKGIRWNVEDPPPGGAIIETNGYGTLEFVEMGVCGMLTCKDETGFESLIPPDAVKSIRLKLVEKTCAEKSEP